MYSFKGSHIILVHFFLLLQFKVLSNLIRTFLMVRQSFFFFFFPFSLYVATLEVKNLTLGDCLACRNLLLFTCWWYLYFLIEWVASVFNLIFSYNCIKQWFETCDGSLSQSVISWYMVISLWKLHKCWWIGNGIKNKPKAHLYFLPFKRSSCMRRQLNQKVFHFHRNA